MNKSAIKYIVGGALVTLGIVLTCIAGVLGCRALNDGMCFTWDHGFIFEKEEASATIDASKVNNLDIDVSCASINVKYGNVDNIQIETKNTFKYIFDVKEEDGTLTIEYGKCWIIFGFNFGHSTEVNITVPEGKIFDNVIIENGVGEGNVSGINVKTLELQNGVGKLTMNNVKVDTLNADNGVGECILNNIDAGNVTLKSGVGAIRYSGTANGDVDVNSGVGEVVMNIEGNINDYYFSVEKGIGEVKVNGNSTIVSNSGAKHIFKVDSGVGSVNITIA